MPINNILSIYETAFFDHQYGFIGESEWSRLSSGGCRHYLVAKEKGLGLGYITDEFGAYLEAGG